MKVELNITNNFNQVIDYVMIPRKPVIFLNFPSQIQGTYGFELMNFGLNIDDDVESQLMNYEPFYAELRKNNFPYKSLFVYGIAKFTFEGIKGADVKFSLDNNFHDGKKAYHTWEYKVNKGDFLYQCGGNASFLPYFTTINLLAGKNRNVTVTFSKEQTVLIDSYEEGYALSKESVYKYMKEKGKLFDSQFIKEHFITEFDGEISTTLAVKDEL